MIILDCWGSAYGYGVYSIDVWLPYIRNQYGMIWWGKERIGTYTYYWSD